MVNKTKKPELSSSAISLAQVLAQANPTNVDAALEEVAKPYSVIIESSDGFLIRYLDYGKLTMLVAKLRKALPAGSYSQYRVHILDSEDKLVWEIEPKSKQSSDMYTVIRYRRKPHWWNREPRAKWEIVPSRDSSLVIASLIKSGYKVLGVTDVNVTLGVNAIATAEWNTMALTLVRGGLNGYTTEE